MDEEEVTPLWNAQKALRAILASAASSPKRDNNFGRDDKDGWRYYIVETAGASLRIEARTVIVDNTIVWEVASVEYR